MRAPSIEKSAHAHGDACREPFYRDALFHAEYGDMINSGQFSGAPGAIAKRKVTEWLEKTGTGKFAVNFKL